MALPTQEHSAAAVSFRLGIITDTSEQMGTLVSVVQQTAHRVAYSVNTAVDSLPLSEDVDAWVVRLSEHSSKADGMIGWLHDRDIPVVIDAADVKVGGDSAQALDGKLRSCVAEHGVVRCGKEPESVWVIAASTGGPEAVIKFLSGLTSVSENKAFIYAQHIEAPALHALLLGMHKRVAMCVKMCVDGEPIEAGNVYLVPTDKVVDISPGRRFRIGPEGWMGPFKPSINQVVAKVARCYRERSGLIVFSGMGDDGADSAKMLRAVGGRVLCQSAETCAVDSMPTSVANGCEVEFSGSPETLSLAIEDRLKQEYMNSSVGK